jgi:hypothetical protein
MKKISMVVVGALAFGVASARADTASSSAAAPYGADPTSPPAMTSPDAPGAVQPTPTDLPAPGINGSVSEPAPIVPLAPAPVYTNQGQEIGYAAPVRPWHTRVGMGLLVGGGFEDFSNGAIRSMTGDGGYWNARVVVGTRQFVGLEAAYVGDARSISGLGLAGNSTLTSNGVEGVARVNIPIVQGPSLIEPFGFVGIGWAHYHVSDNNAATSDVATSDDVMTVPYGGGLELAYRGFMADARFTYRQTYDNNLLDPNGGNLNNWGVGGQIGFEY